MGTPAQRNAPAPAAIRVVVCDDSAFMRRLLRQALERARDIEVVGSAANVREAVALCEALRPDVLTLDLSLPDGDGVSVLRAVAGRSIRVLVVSSLVEDPDGERVIDLLSEGAVDCLGKPRMEDGATAFAAELLERVRDIAAGPAQVPAARRPRPVAVDDTWPRQAPSALVAENRLLVIGASTGGPRALASFLPQLPADFPCPVVVVQHMPKTFGTAFASRLARDCQLETVAAEDGMPIRAGRIYVSVPGHHLHVEGDRLGVRTGRRVNGVVPALDVTLLDAAATWGDRVTAVVLTGIGSDGREGARAVRDNGGLVVAEHESTCAVYGMPRSVVEAGLANHVVALDGLASLLGVEVSP